MKSFLFLLMDRWQTRVGQDESITLREGEGAVWTASYLLAASDADTWYWM
jgi:hypothetical protein